MQKILWYVKGWKIPAYAAAALSLGIHAAYSQRTSV